MAVSETSCRTPCEQWPSQLVLGMSYLELTDFSFSSSFPGASGSYCMFCLSHSRSLYSGVEYVFILNQWQNHLSPRENHATLTLSKSQNLAVGQERGPYADSLLFQDDKWDYQAGPWASLCRPTVNWIQVTGDIWKMSGIFLVPTALLIGYLGSQ